VVTSTDCSSSLALVKLTFELADYRVSCLHHWFLALLHRWTSQTYRSPFISCLHQYDCVAPLTHHISLHLSAMPTALVTIDCL